MKQTDAAFAALADPTRRDIVALLARRPRPVGDIVAHFDISQPAISRHLRVLRESGIVAVDPIGGDRRSRVYRLRADGLQRLDRWIDQMQTFWKGQLDSFGAYVADEIRRPPGERRS